MKESSWRARRARQSPSSARARWAAVVAALVALGCARSNGAAKPAENAAKDRPTVTMPSGRAYTVEIAADAESREQGLMFRESLQDGRGMLFLFPKPSVESFWMKNCNFPIDIVWMDANRKVIFVSAHTPPCKDDPCPTYGPKAESLYVLEIPDAAAAKEKAVVGSTLTFTNLPALPTE
jgi:uncharacterized membrane protein (UPF0127 family)